MKLTHKIKTLSALLIAAGAVATSGCVSQSNTLSFTPPAPTASMNMAQSAIVTVSSKDSRSNSDIASYTRMGELVKLNAQPAPAQGPRGNFNKVFNATRSQSGAFNANNDEIQKVLNDTFKSIVNDIYQDQEVGAAINQYVN